MSGLQKTANWFLFFALLGLFSLYRGGIVDPNIYLATRLIVIIGFFGGLIMEFIDWRIKKKKR